MAAFGAAFLVARAVNRETPARAAAPPVTTTRTAPTTTTASASHRVNVELVSQFSPVKASLKPRPKPHRKLRKPKPPVSVSPAPSISSAPATTVPAAPTYTAPAYSPPAPTHSSSGSTHHKKSSGGSGTTTIGG
ncbi:MAG: hypothetical protein WAU75_20900 [Solirubrobacteraceae bacterium]